jgi:hypothetical protein
VKRLLTILALAGLHSAIPFCAISQTLAPRAYLITPTDSNAITLTYSFYEGGVDFNGLLPITNGNGKYVLPIFTYYRSLNFFGRSANVSASLPYGVGTFTGQLKENAESVYRSGLLDVNFRLSVNLLGGPAMSPKEFSKWRQKRLLGASVQVVAPTGQYDPRRLVNWGINRWAVKPELGYSERWGNWILDGYGGVWFFSTNPAFYNLPVPVPQLQGPMGSFEGHLSYDFNRPRTWVSLDGNFWIGGTTTVNGFQNPATRQTSSRIGGTFAYSLTSHQSLKFAYSSGTYVRFGGNYQNVQFAWQYSWLDHHKPPKPAAVN